MLMRILIRDPVIFLVPDPRSWMKKFGSGNQGKHSGSAILVGGLFMYRPAFTQILEALAKQWRDDPVRYRFFG